MRVCRRCPSSSERKARSTSSNKPGALGAPGALSASPLLLYDGSCGFCAASVQFILRHERRHALRFAALDSDVGRATRARHPDLAGADSMIWVERPGEPNEFVLMRSAAALRIARYMGGPWRFAVAARIVPRPLRDAMYDLVARHRHRLISEGSRCYMPPPAIRSRFLDLRS